MSQLVRPHRHNAALVRRRLSLLDLFGLWRQRRHLRQLDDHQLKDIGLSRTEAEAEARRPIWDAPETWRN